MLMSILLSIVLQISHAKCARNHIAEILRSLSVPGFDIPHGRDLEDGRDGQSNLVDFHDPSEKTIIHIPLFDDIKSLILKDGNTDKLSYGLALGDSLPFIPKRDILETSPKDGLRTVIDQVSNLMDISLLDKIEFPFLPKRLEAPTKPEVTSEAESQSRLDNLLFQILLNMAQKPGRSDASPLDLLVDILSPPEARPTSPPPSATEDTTDLLESIGNGDFRIFHSPGGTIKIYEFSSNGKTNSATPLGFQQLLDLFHLEPVARTTTAPPETTARPEASRNDIVIVDAPNNRAIRSLFNLFGLSRNLVHSGSKGETGKHIHLFKLLLPPTFVINK